MEEVFGHYLKTGSGSTIVRLLLSDTEATIEYDSRWMSSGIRRYCLHWEHSQVSEFYGFLALHSIERYTSYDSNATVNEDIHSLVHDFTEDRGLVPIPLRDVTYAYVRLPAFQSWIADDPALEEMSHFFQLARWPETFNLILWLHFSYGQSAGKWEENEIVSVLKSLDKMKFTSNVDNEFTWPNSAVSIQEPERENEHGQHDQNIAHISTVSPNYINTSEVSGLNDNIQEVLWSGDNSTNDNAHDLSEESWNALIIEERERYLFEEYTDIDDYNRNM